MLIVAKLAFLRSRLIRQVRFHHKVIINIVAITIIIIHVELDMLDNHIDSAIIEVLITNIHKVIDIIQVIID